MRGGRLSESRTRIKREHPWKFVVSAAWMLGWPIFEAAWLVPADRVLERGALQGLATGLQGLACLGVPAAGRTLFAKDVEQHAGKLQDVAGLTRGFNPWPPTPLLATRAVSLQQERLGL